MSRLVRGPRFVLELVPGGSEAATGRQRVGAHATQRAAMERLCEILRQWALSEGAVTPGTTVSLVDTGTVQEVLTVQYMGYTARTLSGGSATWDALAQPTP